MKTLIQRYDSTRKVTVAMHPRYRNWETDSLPCDLAMVTDFQSYNYRYMYFPGDGKKFPWMTFYQSEASVSAMGENYFSMDLDKVIGLAYWGGIDYLGESQGWPNKGWTQGVFDISLEPKPKAYYMRSFFEDEPMVHIAVTDSKGNMMWNGVQTGNEGQSDHWNRVTETKLEITTYTNADEVELVVNGKSYGTKQNDKKSAKMRNQIRWKDITYQPGYCEAIAKTNGKIVARHRIETTGKPVALKIESDNNAWKADGTDLQHLRIYAVDSKGRRVYTATGDVKVTIDGTAASLAAMSSGNQASDELNVVDHRMLFNGSVLAILRSDINAGTITVTATCDGLKSAKAKFTTK
jgi:beta-galactosidase